MTKKHFESLASYVRLELPHKTAMRELRNRWPNTHNEVVLAVAEVLADFCAEQNGRFDRERFLEACRPLP